MCKVIVAEKALDFKRLEQKIYEYVCGWGRELLKQALEGYDWTLAVERDRNVYCRAPKSLWCFLLELTNNFLTCYDAF